MVDHQLLLSKLYKSGFRGFMYDWLASYLVNRKQVVKIKDSISSTKLINMGVPQGSVLGPLLFVVFINSLFLQNFNGKLTAFADDTALSYSDFSYLNLCSLINNDLEVLRKWFHLHKLVISKKN